MPHPIKIVTGALLISLLLLPALPAYEPPAAPAPRPFRYDTDTFSFANETVWNYVNGSVQSESSPANPKARLHAPLLRGDPRRRPVLEIRPLRSQGRAASARSLAARIRDVTERSVWLPALSRRERIVFPGYANLREISAADPGVFQANIGLGWPVYFRAGNMPIVAPVYRETEARLNDEIFHDLQLNYPTIVWLYNFPSLNINHVVVVFRRETGPRTGSTTRSTIPTIPAAEEARLRRGHPDLFLSTHLLFQRRHGHRPRDLSRVFQ
jgi:hypothetical protein